MASLIWSLLCLVCVLYSVLSQDVDVENAREPACLFAENNYKLDECFEDPNSCNRCCCRDFAGDFAVTCTRMFCPKETSKEVVCEYKGKQYGLNENFLSTDGCNTCQCTEGGKVACTEMFCGDSIENNKEEKVEHIEDNFVCEFRGERYNTMDSFDAKDGCNVCTCNADGTVSCTQRECSDLEESGPLYEFSPEGAEAHNEDTLDVEKASMCSYSGKTYMEGESFMADDGCNKCNCAKGGAIACTMMFCVGKNTDGMGICSYNGKSYNLGDKFKSSDGCNTCNCDTSGNVACTQMICDGNNAADVDQNASYKSEERSGAGQVAWSCALFASILAVVA
ncbi:unnamed protein product [Owenia fusiformis]|uniref:Pacifastin domain-containing protein n=1 Tax=Owenia fusiformis TaxID=6347 RepID=A0A8J1UI07_OWEFU|nr:unnamed protein product [Owenia fusiformis]